MNTRAAAEQGSGLGFVIIWAKDVKGTVDFYEKALGLTKRFFVETPDGGYAEFGAATADSAAGGGSTTFAVSSVREATRVLPGTVAEPSPQAVSPVQLRFVLENVETVYRAAIQAGATPVSEPETQAWGTVLARFRDPNGVVVSLMTPLTPKHQALRLHTVHGPATAEIVRQPQRASEVLSRTVPFRQAAAGEDRAVVDKLLNQMSDAQLAEMFSGAQSLGAMEAAIISRL